MTTQVLLDGLMSGVLIGLGAIGVTLTYSILGFANFAHGEFISFGAYATLLIASGVSALIVGSDQGIGSLSISPAVIAASLLAMALTAGLALALDWILFSRLRGKSAAISVVMASFGASMAIRAALEFAFTSRPAYFSHDLQIARPIAFGVKATPNQIALLAVAVMLLTGVHLLLTRTQIGRAMRAVSENQALARAAGVDVDATIRAVWALGGALASAAGYLRGFIRRWLRTRSRSPKRQRAGSVRFGRRCPWRRTCRGGGPSPSGCAGDRSRRGPWARDPGSCRRRAGCRPRAHRRSRCGRRRLRHPCRTR